MTSEKANLELEEVLRLGNQDEVRIDLSLAEQKDDSDKDSNDIDDSDNEAESESPEKESRLLESKETVQVVFALGDFDDSPLAALEEENLDTTANGTSP
eukprot:gene6232-12623_t